MELRTVFEEARDLAARLYVLAAPLHNDSLPGALSDRPDHVVCLMDGGADVQAVSPHLVHIPFDHFEAAREWLEQHGPVSPPAPMSPPARPSPWAVGAATGTSAQR